MFFNFEYEISPGFVQELDVEVDTNSIEFEDLVKKLAKKAWDGNRKQSTAANGAVIVTLKGKPRVAPGQMPPEGDLHSYQYES